MERFPAMVGQQGISPAIPQFTPAAVYTPSPPPTATRPERPSPPLPPLPPSPPPPPPPPALTKPATNHPQQQQQQQQPNELAYILIVRADKPQGRFLVVGLGAGCVMWGCCAIGSRSTVSNDDDEDTTSEEDNTDEDEDGNDGIDDQPEPVNRTDLEPRVHGGCLIVGSPGYVWASGGSKHSQVAARDICGGRGRGGGKPGILQVSFTGCVSCVTLHTQFLLGDGGGAGGVVSLRSGFFFVPLLVCSSYLVFYCSFM